MKMQELIERYATLIVGLFLMSIGIALSIHAQLGITPISCPPYVLSLGLRPTVGQFTIAMHVLFVLIQVAILRRSFPKLQYMQLVMGFLFGFFIDFSVWLTEWMVPEAYWMRVLYVIVGSAILAVGIVFEVTPKVMLIAGEGLMLVLAKLWKKPFGKVKIGFDCSLIAISLVFSFFLFGEIRGVREGTLISALLVGFFVGKIQPRMAWLGAWLDRHQQEAKASGAGYTVVTIAREFGSGGHEIGEKLAARLGWKFYDRELVNLTVGNSGLSTQYVEAHDQRLSSFQRVWKDIWMDNLMPVDESLSPDDRLFVAQSRVIRRAAEEGPCVIVGRCANVILKDRPQTFHVFISADSAFACQRIAAEQHLSPDEALREYHRINQLRANHYNYYTQRTWGDPSGYDLCLRSSSLGIDGAVDTIYDLVTFSHPKN